MTDDYEYFRNKRPDRVYLSRSLGQKQFRRNSSGKAEQFERPFRIVSKVIDCGESHEFFRDGKQISLRITHGIRQQIVAKFYEDNRDIFSLQLQRYSTETGEPHHFQFTFRGDEIATLYNFIRNIDVLPLEGDAGGRLDDAFVSSLVLTRDQALALLEAQPDLVEELLRSQVTAKDLAELAHRRGQLAEFRRLLDEPEYFESRRSLLGAGKGPEAVWQTFFEENTWIFGYGLNYIFNTSLDGAKLETVVKGSDFATAGKRVDALLKTQGLVSSLAFGEIKTHRSALLKPVASPYRRECWQISDEIAGGVAQIQRSVQTSLSNISTRTEIKDATGAPTGEVLFLYQPRSFLVIGSLAEFRAEHGINEEKFSSFEMFRRSLRAPEIVCFDELYERAKFIVASEALQSDV
jgi:hypothetical protein